MYHGAFSVLTFVLLTDFRSISRKLARVFECSSWAGATWFVPRFILLEITPRGPFDLVGAALGAAASLGLGAPSILRRMRHDALS